MGKWLCVLLSAIPRALGLVLFAALCLAELGAAAGIDCDSLRMDLERKKMRLQEYTTAVQTEEDQHNSQTMGALSNKINELIRQIRISEEQMEDCLEKYPPESESLGPVKSDLEQYATKDCDELRGMLIPLLRKINQFRRREHSVFSELNRSEKSEFAEAKLELQNVTAALKARCSGPSPGKPRKRH